MSEYKVLEGQKEAWEEIDAIVLECQQTKCNKRKDELLQELIIRFDPFINMFYDLLVNEKTYLNNKVSRDFICLYIADKNLRFKIFRNTRLSKTEFNEVNRSLSLIRDNYGKNNDVMTDLHYVFTQMVLTYKKTNRSFNTFVTYVFKYRLFHFISKFLRDRINNGYDRTAFEEVNLNGYNSMHHMNIEDQVTIDDNGNFSDSWLSGLTCSDVFDELNELERNIIVKIFVQTKRPKDIQKELGISEAKYRKHRRLALSKLEAATGLKTKYLKPLKASE